MGHVQKEGQSANLEQVCEYAGNLNSQQNVDTAFNASFSNSDDIGPCSWIIDMRATTHMCASPNLFSKLKQTTRHISVKLPYNRTKHVTQEGNVNLSSAITLEDVLYISSFRYNLLSVNKLTSNTESRFTFYPTYCLLQDQKSDHTLLKGRAVGSLYVFDMMYVEKNAV